MCMCILYVCMCERRCVGSGNLFPVLTCCIIGVTSGPDEKRTAYDPAVRTWSWMWQAAEAYRCPVEGACMCSVLARPLMTVV